ncbi:CRISPR-associated protein Cas4 [Caldilinea sp.]|uniref:CRISPR-associated protein Cas4 n=1 Tax=Caldilinea sp. TaxID=2293560 RepID=UPI002C43CCCA|nr:CRISPR-associated protein Cas4 [Caldilinea sp.]HRA65259.1 CRISPR-associated protein Cas4 [Caldilinea sp.]
MTSFLFLLLIILLAVAGLALWLWGRRQRRASGVPAGAVVYSDTGAEQAVAQPLISRRYGLIGKPDYLVEVTEQGRRTLIPVEVKSGRAPASPRESHVLQLATYCLILEDLHGAAPAYGILRYADGAFTVPYTPELRRAVLAAAASIRAGRTAVDLPRSHQDQARCTHCGYQDACGARWSLSG